MSEAKALYLSTEMDTEIRTFTVGDSYNLIRDAVEGWIECYYLSSLGVDLWCNEESKLAGLARNEIATYLFQKEFGPHDYIGGNVIFTGGTDGEGETLGLSEDQIKTLTDLFGEV
jgi:hypothetical protein